MTLSSIKGLSGIDPRAGVIASSSDFPTSGQALTAKTQFLITASVTDNDSTRTNTGQSFVSGDYIVWNGTNWTKSGTNSSFVENVFHNPNFEVWQKGTSFAGVTASSIAYYLGRFNWYSTSSSVFTISRSTDVPTVAESGKKFNYSLSVDCTTTDASIGAADVITMSQVIEGYVWSTIAQSPLKCSFWIKSTKTGVYGVALRSGGYDRTYVSEITVNVSDTWEFKTVYIPASPSAGTWNYTTGAGAVLTFTFLAGANSQGTANTWASTNYVTSSNQVNLADSTSNTLLLTGVELTKSTSAGTRQRAYAEELDLCRRYHTRIVAGAPFTAFGSGGTFSTTNASFYVKYPVSMRASPAFNYSALSIWSNATTAAVTAVVAVDLGLDSFSTALTSAGAFTAGNGALLLANNNSAAFIDLDAEFY